MDFFPIEPQRYQQLFPYFKGQPYELCEYSLATLTVWANREYQPRAAFGDDSVIVRGEFVKRKDLNHLMLPLSSTREYSPEDLYGLARQLGMKSFWFVPATYINKYGRANIEKIFAIEEQTAYADYIYRTEDLATLKGNRFAKKRNLISQFLKNHSEKDLQFRPITSTTRAECLFFLEEWCATRQCDENLEDSLTCERLAAEKMLQNIEAIDSQGLLLRIRGKIAAFGISSYLTDSMGILQFEKAFEDIKGLYQFFDRECCCRLFNGFEYINKESDMEVPGLAKSKKSYHPIRRERSYQLNLLPNGK